MRLVDPNGREYDGYEGSNGQYQWFDNHSEKSFTDNNNVTWSKVTNNRANWNEATTIRNANIEGLVSLGFNRSQVEKDVRLYNVDNQLFTKESKLNNAQNYTKEWTSAKNSGGPMAAESPEINNSGYSLKFYPAKNGEKNALGITRSDGFFHLIECGLELIERKIFKDYADKDPLYDMHYGNACGLLKDIHNSAINISAPPSIYSNYHRSGGMKLP